MNDQKKNLLIYHNSDNKKKQFLEKIFDLFFLFLFEKDVSK